MGVHYLFQGRCLSSGLCAVSRCPDLDVNGDGKLSHKNLEDAMTGLDVDITPKQAHALVQFIGEDGTTYIDPAVALFET